MKTRILFNGNMGIGKTELAKKIEADYALPLITGSKHYSHLNDNFRELVLALDIRNKQDSDYSYVSDRSVLDFVVGCALQNGVALETLVETVTQMYANGSRLFNTSDADLTILVIAPYVNPLLTIPPGHAKRPILERMEERGAGGLPFFMYSLQLAHVLNKLDQNLFIITNDRSVFGTPIGDFVSRQEALDHFRQDWQDASYAVIRELMRQHGREPVQHE